MNDNDNDWTYRGLLPILFGIGTRVLVNLALAAIDKFFRKKPKE